MECPREDAMLEAFSQFIASVASTRTQLLVREGNHLSDVEANPPVFIKSSPGCRSCKRPTNGRVLCASCRSKPVVENGPPLVDIMYRSSNKKYDIPRGSDKETILVILHSQKSLAMEAYRMAEELLTWCQSVYKRWKQTNGSFSGDVYFTPELVNRGGSYHKQIICGAPGILNRSVMVGGLGPSIHAVVKQSVVEWLFAIDGAFRAEFEIPLNRDIGDTSLMANLVSFATLIANRVVLMENVSEDDPTQHLCTLSCEHLAKIQYVRCEYFTRSSIKRDIIAMRLLVKIASKTDIDAAMEELVNDTKSARTALLELLQDPPPEMLLAFPTFVVDMNFETLRDVIGLIHVDGIDATLLAIESWRESVRVEFLCMLINKAITAANGWEPPFLNCLQPVSGRGMAVASSLCLPAMGWVDGVNTTSKWRLVGNSTHRQRRSGLDPTGLRIVLMSAALIQLMGCEEPAFFVPGAVRCDILHGIVNTSMESSLHAIEALRDQMRPLSMGIEWIHSRGQMQCWQNSHVDTHVRKALSLLGGFSYQELSDRFLGDMETLCDDCGEVGEEGKGCCNKWCGSCYLTTQRALPDTLKEKILPRVSTLMLPLRPKEGYDAWLGLTVKIAIPMLFQLRQSLGFAMNVRTNPIGDHLRLFPSIRAWKPSDGEITLTFGEVYDIPVVKQLLVESALQKTGLAKEKRVRTTKVWAFNPEKLRLVLGSF